MKNAKKADTPAHGFNLDLKMKKSLRHPHRKTKGERAQMSETSSIPIRQDSQVVHQDKKKPPFLFAEGDIVTKDKKLLAPCTKKNLHLFEDVTIDGIDTKLNKHRLRNFEDIREGDTVFSTWYDGKPVAMKVENINPEEHTALGRLNNHCWGNLSFNDDWRKCWRCGGYSIINDYAFAKIELTDATSIKEPQ